MPIHLSEDALKSWIEGRLSAKESKNIAHHHRNCLICQEAATDIQLLIQAYRVVNAGEIDYQLINQTMNVWRKEFKHIDDSRKPLVQTLKTELLKGRLKNYLAFCRQNVQSFGDFCQQLMPSYFCTIPKPLMIASVSMGLIFGLLLGNVASLMFTTKTNANLYQAFNTREDNTGQDPYLNQLTLDYGNDL